jgi:Mg2+/Co2+ transporter CorC
MWFRGLRVVDLVPVRVKTERSSMPVVLRKVAEVPGSKPIDVFLKSFAAQPFAFREMTEGQP